MPGLALSVSVQSVSNSCTILEAIWQIEEKIGCFSDGLNEIKSRTKSRNKIQYQIILNFSF